MSSFIYELTFYSIKIADDFKIKISVLIAYFSDAGYDVIMEVTELRREGSTTYILIEHWTGYKRFEPGRTWEIV